MGGVASCCGCLGIIPDEKEGSIDESAVMDPADPTEPPIAKKQPKSKNHTKQTNPGKSTRSTGIDKQEKTPTKPDDPTKPLITEKKKESPVTIKTPENGEYKLPFASLVGKKIEISGQPTSNMGGFAFELRSRKNICFHYNPRLKWKQIIRNTKSQAAWGDEEKDLQMEFPFKSSIEFQTIITIEDDVFAVEINGQKAFEFPRRLKDENDPIIVLRTAGDVEIRQIRFY